jgi:hypothetical protein
LTKPAIVALEDKEVLLLKFIVYMKLASIPLTDYRQPLFKHPLESIPAAAGL